MELIFLLSPAVPEVRQDEILTALRATLPAARVDFNRDRTAVRVILPDTTDRFAAADAVTFRLLGFGFEAKEATRGAPPRGDSASRAHAQATPPISNVPPTPTPAPTAPTAQKKRRTVRLSTFIIVLVAVVLAMSLAFGSVLMTVLGDKRTLGKDGSEDYVGKIAIVDSIFAEYGVYNEDGDLLLDEMLRAYVAATGDPYAAYYNAAEYEALLASNRGEMVGIGVTVVESLSPAGIYVVDVFSGGPAEAAGVLAGDIITHIKTAEGNLAVADIGYEPALSKFAGAAGTVAEFTVLRGTEAKQFAVTRAAIQMTSVRSAVSTTDKSVGIVRISQFMATTPKEFKAEMETLIAAGCTRFVFDVRNNPGGSMAAICGVLTYLLPADSLICTEVWRDGTTEEHYAKAQTYNDDYKDCSVDKADVGKYKDYRMSVLVNGNTASAAELFAAALRDHEKATLVGVTTYGKGVAQQIIPLAEWGYAGAIRLTIAHYNPPCGINYDGVGVKPHTVLPIDEAVANKNLSLLTEAEDNQLQAAIAAVKQ
ncbi:MAG: PDZ domain-containing protein [Clostridia bacterium]|nr:PDZ domain-containing protein [Clostridia bacterium]